MTKLTITAVMSAMAAAARAMAAEESAREEFDGTSWDYHGASYCEDVERETGVAEETLETYIKQRVQEALAELIENRTDLRL